MAYAVRRLYLVLELRQARVRWPVIFSLSGYSASLAFLRISSYFLAIFSGYRDPEGRSACAERSGGLCVEGLSNNPLARSADRVYADTYKERRVCPKWRLFLLFRMGR